MASDMLSPLSDNFTIAHDGWSTSASSVCSHNIPDITATAFPTADPVPGRWRTFASARSEGKPAGFVQEAVAIVSMACRLPDDCNTPSALWKFLEDGRVAKNTPPETRFDIKTHHDGSLRPETMPSPGGMFLQGVDPRDLDAQFFRLSPIEATSMDPQQRQLLEVVYEGLENAGITMDDVNGAAVGCFIASFACDYGDAQARDPECRAAAAQVGVGRTMLSNRISHFFNLKGPSMTLDTACSGSLTCVDLACRYLQTREIDSAIVGAANMYLSPEHVMDHYMGAEGTASLSGKCHTFDAKADGYIKAEAVNMLYLKRLDDAIRDGDPIRAIIRGSATNSDGWTAGIASPNSDAQAAVIRRAYSNAGITDLSLTSYVEFHGTGTRAGDAIEARGVAAVFAPHRAEQDPLWVGSIKANVGHSEPAAGISALIKTVLSLENAVIPGNPTFITPNPKIDFQRLRISPCRHARQWKSPEPRRASVNSFGYGGSNAHVVVDEYRGPRSHTSSYVAEADDLFAEDQGDSRPRLLVFSANDQSSLENQLTALDRHLSNPAVRVQTRDLAYTLSERRSRHYRRGYTIVEDGRLDLQNLQQGTALSECPRIGLIMTGQGAQWSQMGKDLLDNFPAASRMVRYLDKTLHNLSDPPTWSLFEELYEARSAQYLQDPCLSQPLVTALQLGILAVLQESGLYPQAVVGHSSGEIAAAVASGWLTPEQAILVAYYRGKATSETLSSQELGMMAVGLGAEAVASYLGDTTLEVACINSPQSVTLSGCASELAALEKTLTDEGHFARRLRVDVAYHSRHMQAAADEYLGMLQDNVPWYEAAPSADAPQMHSSTTGYLVSSPLGRGYWVQNMSSTVLFDQALKDVLTRDRSLDLLVEIGPSNALSGPVGQIQKALGSTVSYTAAWKRGPSAERALLHLGGTLFTVGCPISLAPFNADDTPELPQFISDLPNYCWNHSVKYWHETEASKDWRFRKFVHHDLLGTKILGMNWTFPSWKKVIRLSDLTWLRDHVLGENVVFPGAGYIAMATEAIFQKSVATGQLPAQTAVDSSTYKLRNVIFHRMLTLHDGQDTRVELSLHACSRNITLETWHEFVISSVATDITTEHCRGLVRIDKPATTFSQRLPAGQLQSPDVAEALGPLSHPTPASHWYAALRSVGMHFGPAFKRQIAVESVAGSPTSRAHIDLTPPSSRYPQSRYPLHPTAIDACFQTSTAALSFGCRSEVTTLRVPALIDDLVIFARTEKAESPLQRGVAVANAKWTGNGRQSDTRQQMVDLRAYDTDSGGLLLDLKGLRFHDLESLVPTPPHTYCKAVWAEDVNFLTPEKMRDVLLRAGETTAARVAKLAQLCTHKTPSARILEVELGAGETSPGKSIWFDEIRHTAGDLAGACQVRLCFASQAAGLEARRRYAAEPNVEYRVHDAGTMLGGEGSAAEAGFDIVLLRVSDRATASDLEGAIKNARSRLTAHGYLVCLDEISSMARSGMCNGSTEPAQAASPSCTDAKPASLLEQVQPSDFDAITGFPRLDGDFLRMRFIARPSRELDPAQTTSPIHLLHMNSARTKHAVAADLRTRGWSFVEEHLPLRTDFPSGSTVLVLDEMFDPVLPAMTADQHSALQALITLNCRVVWVTMGAQMRVTHPEHSLIYGTARTLLLEHPTNLILCLDVEHNDKISSFAAIDVALHHIRSVDDLKNFDSEFVERDGILHISRIVPDTAVSGAEQDVQRGGQTRPELLRSQSSRIRLISDRQGTLDSLVYAETEDTDPLGDDEVEVEIFAAALNFKDLANAMGFVPANDHFFGLEGAGVVSRTGKRVYNVQEGDRVFVVSTSEQGCFANRVRTGWHGVHRLPAWMSFEEGATLGTCYLTVIHCLVNVASVKRGQSILIHSATGGVGLAAIQLCKYLGVEIFATVGTSEKRSFLVDNYNISEDHIFSSRSTDFAAQLMHVTHGHGVDVVLNSLTGDMLQESWRCIAENGTFVEIGKRDLVDRSSLSMEPFNRNASYRAVDMSRKGIPTETIFELGTYLMDKITRGHLKPLHICRVFPFQETVDAFRYMQQGKHFGKIVVSYAESGVIQVPVRPIAPRPSLRPDVSYLIVGGLRGVCGSLALYMARHGARNLVVMARSDFTDATSQSVMHSLAALDCHITPISGDVTCLSSVRAAVKNAPRPIVGVIHGAMVLRDGLFSSMTPSSFLAPISPKVAGTWNLHTVSLEQDTPLDFFTMLTSVSGLVGHISQSNYAAACVFQDSFASYRRQLGLRACAVDLGVVGDVGYLVEHNLMPRLEAQGWTPIGEALLHRILAVSILQQQRQHLQDQDSSRPVVDSLCQLITGLPVPIVPPRNPLDPVHRFSALAVSATRDSQTQHAQNPAADGVDLKLAILKRYRASSSPKDSSSSLDRGVVLAAAVDVVNAVLARSLGAAEPLEPQRPLASYGIDSLVAVELRNWARRELGIEVSGVEVVGAKTLLALCEGMVEKMGAL